MGGGAAVTNALTSVRKGVTGLVSGKDKDEGNDKVEETMPPTADQGPNGNQASPTTSQASGLEDEKKQALDLDDSHAASAIAEDTNTKAGVWGNVKSMWSNLTGRTKAEDPKKPELSATKSADGSKNTQPDASDPLKQSPTAVPASNQM